MPVILVADNIAEEGLERLRQTPNVTFDVQQKLPPERLAEIIGGYDGILIRSAVKITKEVLENPGQLMAIARAGAGVDNVDIDAATAAGVLVLNTPDANTVSTAEHTFAMMLAMHRRIPEAHEHVRSGKWDRASIEGHQLAGSTLGIIGLGRVGMAVARRALAFEMNVIAFDPFVQLDSAMEGRVTLFDSLHDLLATADCVTFHASLTAQTRHLIGPEELAIMKKGARLVNCARGLLIDEKALAEALASGHIGGAALDVYENEPPANSPLLTAPNVVLAPHIAASTLEAQARVSVDAVDNLLAYLLRGEIRSAVNVTGMPTALPPRGRAFVDLCSRMGRILSPWCREGVERVRVTVYSESLRNLATTMSSQVVAALLEPHLEVRVNIINAAEVAKQRGIVVDHLEHSIQPNQLEAVHAVVEARGDKHEIEGTVLSDGRPRILGIDGYRMELVPAGPMALIFNDDRPGAIGLVGQVLGDAGINVADMALSRRNQRALMVLTLDSPMPDEVVANLMKHSPPITAIRRAELPPVGKVLP